MASLYELSAGYATILDAYETAESQEDRDELLDMLAESADEITHKAEQYARIIRNTQSDVLAFRDEAARLLDKARANENLVKRLQQAMYDSMKLTGQTEIRTSIGKWKIQNNPWSCEVVDIDKVPMEYHIKVEDKIDKKGLLAKFKADGEFIDGVEFRQAEGIRFR